MNKEEIVSKIISYLKSELEITDENFSDDSDLFEEGYIESIRLEKIFTYLEREFKITFNDDCFFDERISKVSGIADIISTLQSKA